MPKSLLQFLGWTLARTPEPVLRVIVAVLGEFTFWLRKRILLSNLSHAFPTRPALDRRAIARASARRLIETGLLSLATPYLSIERLRTIVQAAPSLTQAIVDQQAAPEPMLLATAHMAYWEIQTCMPMLVPEPFPEMGVIFRPVDNPELDAWIKQTRERFGMRLLSRKQGFQEALTILRRQGIIGLLFDQNAGMQGALSTLFGRICSTTELPGLLANKFSARVYALYPQRIGFWRVKLHVDEIASDRSTTGVTLSLNRWLEQKLSGSDDFCASWLWAHERWKNQDIPARRLRLEAKRNLVAEDLAARAWTQLPRKTRLWIRLPNWLGDVAMALPLLRAIRQSRPDAEITLVAKSAFHSLLHEWAVADHLIALPEQGSGYFRYFWKLRTAYPDCTLLFTNSFRADLEAWLTRSPQRFGILRSGKRRPLLTHAYRVPPGFSEKEQHQLTLWTQFLDHFGLAQPPDRQPTAAHQAPAGLVIGLIAGSENNPEKRWPVAHWCALIDELPADARIILFGTAIDRRITDEITARCSRPVENMAGRTKLPEYCRLLGECSALVTNDTGGMHLANALGVPLIALFGPTNPVRTGPVFDAPALLLQPPGCPPTGGGSLEDLTSAQVLVALRQMLPERLSAV